MTEETTEIMTEEDLHLTVQEDGVIRCGVFAKHGIVIFGEPGGEWRVELHGKTQLKGKAKSEENSCICGIIACCDWIKALDQSIKMKQEALANEHCVPKRFVKPGEENGV
jgi:hypothetical protein